MKKLICLFLLLATICSMLSGCTNTEGKPTLIGDAEPAQYQSEAAFVSAIKNGGESNGWDIKSIKYYYRPKNVPEGATLRYVQVRDTYVMFAYTLDKDKNSSDATKDINYKWFRSFDGGRTHPEAQAFIEDLTSFGDKEIYTLKRQRENTIFVSDRSFNDAKALMDDINTAWTVSWVQDGECFGGSVPYSIPEEDIAKYLEMEKVVIE